MTDQNTSADLFLTFQGYFTVIVSGTPYRFRELQDMDYNIKADSEKHYSDAGVKKKYSAGDSSIWRIVIKNTADLYETVDPPVSSYTISQWIFQIMGGDSAEAQTRALPSMTFDSVSQSVSSTNQFVHQQFIGTVEGIEKQRNRETGTEELIISGEIMSIVENLRAAS